MKRVLWCLTLSVAGCAFTPVAEGDGGLPFESWCERAGDDLRCRPLVACGVAADLSCREQLQPWPLADPAVACSPALIDAVDAGRVRYDQAAALHCLQQLASACAAVRPACEQVLVGVVPPGEPCHSGHECRPGAWCDRSTCPGTCRLQGGAGAEVATPEACNSPVVDGLEDGGFRCGALLQLGEACDAASRCAAGLRCGVEQRCEAAVPEPTQFSRRGEACTGAFQGIALRFCQLGLACHLLTATEGVCGARFEVGQRCTGDPRGCVRNARCSGGECVPLNDVGSSCLQTTDCVEGLACHADGRCGARLGRRSTCTSSLDCLEGLRCESRVCVVAWCD